MSRRTLNLAGFLACAGLMAYALYSQYQLMLDPCPLCIFQRVAVIALGLVFLLAFIHHPLGWGRQIYALLVLAASATGAFVAGRHVWLQNLPPDQVPSCGPGLGFMMESFPLLEVFEMVLTGSGECASVDWSLLGLSMPAWVLIAIGVLGVFGVLNNLRR